LGLPCVTHGAARTSDPRRSSFPYPLDSPRSGFDMFRITPSNGSFVCAACRAFSMPTGLGTQPSSAPSQIPQARTGVPHYTPRPTASRVVRCSPLLRLLPDRTMKSAPTDLYASARQNVHLEVMSFHTRPVHAPLTAPHVRVIIASTAHRHCLPAAAHGKRKSPGKAQCGSGAVSPGSRRRGGLRTVIQRGGR